MSQDLLSSLTSLSQLVANASSQQRGQSLTPAQIEQLLAAAKVHLETLSQNLRTQLETPSVPRLPLEVQVVDKQKLPSHIVQKFPELAKLVQQLPPTHQANTRFFDVSFQSGQDVIKITLPDVLAKTLTTKNSYQLVFQPGVPPSLSQINLINNPALQGLQTPLDINPLVSKNDLLPVTHNSFVQALALPQSVTPTTPSPQSIKGGDRLILHVLTVSNQGATQSSPETSSLQKAPLLEPSAIGQKLKTFIPFLKSDTVQTTPPPLTQTTGETTKVPTNSVITPPSSNKATPTPQIIQVGQHSVNLQAPTNQQAPIQQGRVIGHFEGSPIVEIQPSASNSARVAGTPSTSPQFLILTHTKLAQGQEISLRILKPQSSLESALQPQPTSIHEPHLTPEKTRVKWDSFDRLLLAVETLVPEASSLLQSQIPTPGKQNSQQLSTSLLFFLKALQLKTPAQNWLPQTISQNYNSEQMRLPLQNLEADFEQLVRVVRDTATGQEFQRFTLPIQMDDQIQPFYIFMRPFSEENKYQHHDSSKKDALAIKDKKKKEVRFLVNVNLSHMGAVQLDGLFKNKNLNMILRLKEALSPDIKNQLITRYTKVLESLGLEGTMRFQGASDWVSFEDDSMKMQQVDI